MPGYEEPKEGIKKQLSAFDNYLKNNDKYLGGEPMVIPTCIMVTVINQSIIPTKLLFLLPLSSRPSLLLHLLHGKMLLVYTKKAFNSVAANNCLTNVLSVVCFL